MKEFSCSSYGNDKGEKGMEIKWSDLALRQLDDILDYVEEHFGSHTAIFVVMKMLRMLISLSISPKVKE